MSEVRLLTVCDCDACQTTKRENICNGIAAQAVRAMNTASHFADSMESGNDLTVSVNDLSVGIDHKGLLQNSLNFRGFCQPLFFW